MTAVGGVRFAARARSRGTAGRPCRVVAVVAGALVAVGGCGSSTGGHATPPPRPAADGSDVSACADARCEVSVRAGTAIPVPASTDIGDLTVTEVTGDRVTLTGHALGSSSGGTCIGQCDSSSSNGAFTVTLGSDSRATENGLSVAVVSIADGAAVLALDPVS